LLTGFIDESASLCCFKTAWPPTGMLKSSEYLEPIETILDYCLRHNNREAFDFCFERGAQLSYLNSLFSDFVFIFLSYSIASI
jgi:hypothetical protein